MKSIEVKQTLSSFFTVTAADPRGAPPARAPHTAQNFLDFMQFLGKFDKIL